MLTVLSGFPQFIVLFRIKCFTLLGGKSVGWSVVAEGIKPSPFHLGNYPWSNASCLIRLAWLYVFIGHSCEQLLAGYLQNLRFIHWQVPNPLHIPTTWGSNSNPFENTRLNSLNDDSVELRPTGRLAAGDGKISLWLLCKLGQKCPQVNEVSGAGVKGQPTNQCPFTYMIAVMDWQNLYLIWSPRCHEFVTIVWRWM